MAQHSGAAPSQEAMLNLQVGEVKVLGIPDVALVAVCDCHIINAVATDEKEVIVFARHEGSTALQIWSADGQRWQYQIEVAPEGLDRQSVVRERVWKYV